MWKLLIYQRLVVVCICLLSWFWSNIANYIYNWIDNYLVQFVVYSYIQHTMCLPKVTHEYSLVHSSLFMVLCILIQISLLCQIDILGPFNIHDIWPWLTCCFNYPWLLNCKKTIGTYGNLKSAVLVKGYIVFVCHSPPVCYQYAVHLATFFSVNPQNWQQRYKWK